MPAQALIRKLNKTQIEAEISKANAKDLLEVEAHKSGGFLVKCKPLVEGGQHSAEGAPEALQAVCDADAKLVRDEEAARLKAEEDAKAKAKTSAEKK